MTKWPKLISLAAVVLVAGAVSGQSGGGAGSTTLSWVPANSYTDGRPMQLGEQRLYVAKTNDAACGTPPQTFDQFAVVSAGIASFVHSGLWNSTYYYTAVSVDLFGNASVNSNVACKRINLTGNWEPPPVGTVPNPPTNLQAL